MTRSLPVALFLLVSVLAACEPAQPQPDAVAKSYAEAWKKADYQKMWSLLSDGAQQRVGTEGFVDRLPRIAVEMTLRSLDVAVGPSSRPLANGSPDPAHATIPLDITYHTARVGDVRRTTTLAMVYIGEKDKGVWKIDWSPEALLPNLVPGRLVRMMRLVTTRGRILARDGTELATFVEAAVVGVVPGQIRSEAGMLASLSSVLGMKPTTRSCPSARCRAPQSMRSARSSRSSRACRFRRHACAAIRPASRRRRSAI
ncbi:MAG: hypothetical protein AUH85_12615 [Chloroflexi bacterium 13_1_40CM_4_68_4]|nr:MAG: hypothetical protein AUH85_12615 [Chloroflexi bacterium 13_1_40CM_4_68_4]